MAARCLLVLALAAGGTLGHCGDLTIRFTASLNGSLDGCDCKVGPRAGLVKLAAWLRSSHRSGTDLLLDGGDFLDGTPDEKLAREILETYADLGYGAIAVGERDLAAGMNALIGYRERYPLLANNLWLRSAAGGWTPFSPSPAILRAGALSVAVIALLDPALASELPASLSGSVRLDPAREAATRLLRDPRVESAGLVVLLYHGPSANAEELLRQTDGVDVVVVAHEQKLISAERVGHAILVSPGEAGNRVGTLTVSRAAFGGLRFGLTFQAFSAKFGPDDPATRARSNAYDAELRSRLRAAVP